MNFDTLSTEDRWRCLDQFEQYGARTLLSASMSLRPGVSETAIEALDLALRANPELKESPRPSMFDGWLPQKDRSGILRVLESKEAVFAFAVVCSFVADDYVREAAVRNLIDMSDSRALPYLMLRSGDWVEPIRELAAEAAAALITKADIATLVECFGPFFLLREEAIGREARVGQVYFEQLLHRPGLLAAVRMWVWGEKEKWLLDQALLGPDENWKEVLRPLAARPNPMNWATTVQHIRKLEPEAQIDLLKDLSSSHIREARLLALELADKLDQVPVLEARLMDRSGRVRNEARLYLGKRGFQDFAGTYRAAFPTPSAVAGFGEVAREEELKELLVYIDHPLIPVRKKTIIALGRREFRDAADRISARLYDPSPGVVREATKALGRLRASFSTDEILLLDDRSRLPGLIRARRRSIYRWDRLAVILNLVGRKAFAGNPNLTLQNWLGRRWRDDMSPSAQQIDRASRELAVAKVLLRPAIAAEVREELDYWTKRLAPSGWARLASAFRIGRHRT